MRTGSRRFSPGFDGVHRGCASQSEKQRRGAKFCELAEEVRLGTSGLSQVFARLLWCPYGLREPERKLA